MSSTSPAEKPSTGFFVSSAGGARGESGDAQGSSGRRSHELMVGHWAARLRPRPAQAQRAGRSARSQPGQGARRAARHLSLHTFQLLPQQQRSLIRHSVSINAEPAPDVTGGALRKLNCEKPMEPQQHLGCGEASSWDGWVSRALRGLSLCCELPARSSCEDEAPASLKKDKAGREPAVARGQSRRLSAKDRNRQPPS